MQQSPLFIILHENGATMWLKREMPLVWGGPAEAKC
jgi:hypothetical protein